ncbi:MAG TPA: hypothetical protein VMM92_01000 [Thermoanaerobaculia bacterium]|nr:hypothetical protein [Thermoanaerobaculia bacterium]
MRSQTDSTPALSNAFSAQFLLLLDERDEPATSAEADVCGPWKVEAGAEGYALLRQGESLARGDRPSGLFAHRETALLAAAILPALGRDPFYRLQSEETPNGFALERTHGEIAGHLEFYDPEAVSALHLAESLVRSPESLAHLLEAAGRVALDRAGKIVFERVG